ncbi:MAG TPA: PIG-L family deacetylase [Rhodanobacteraceae bacterium]|nr:PIG-L family deacetylase [Rhodanobacteraceae bacterium]
MRHEQSSDPLDPDVLLRRAGARLMVLAPHPDDESLAAGGLIQRARAYGVPVSVVFVSDGENNPWPQRVLERRLWIGPRQRGAWAARRRGEADSAIDVLGGDAIRVTRLGWPDGGVTARLLHDTAAMLAQLRELIVRERPSVLVLPDLVDRHPDHSALHVLMEMVFQGLPRELRPECLGYLLHGRARPGMPRRAQLALTAEEAAAKRRAIDAHASQMALSRRRLMRFATGHEVFFAGMECHDLQQRRLPWLPPAPLRPALALLLADAHGGLRVPLASNGKAELRWRDGSPAARVPRALQAPFYAKLYCTLPSPWIFDGWGWCRFGVGGA